MVRAVAAAVALLAGVVGPPWALLRFVGSPLPHGMLRLDEILAALTQPPDPQLVLQALAWVCWAGWAVFVLDVLAAAGQHLADHIGNRHDQPHGTARERTWRPGALLIGVLIAALLTVSRPAPTGGAHGGPTVVAPVVHTLTTGSFISNVTGSFADRLGDGGGRSTGWVRVLPPEHGHHDSLWRIAERELGDGACWPELYARNAGVPQADGRALVRPELIQPGWELAVPTTPHPDDPTAPPTSRPHTAPTPAAPNGPGAPPGTRPAVPTTAPASPVLPGGAPTAANPADAAPASGAPGWVEIGAGLAVTAGLATAVAATLWRIHRARTAPAEPTGPGRSGRGSWSSTAAYPIAHELARRSPWIPSSAQPPEGRREDLRHTDAEDSADDAGRDDTDDDGRENADDAGRNTAGDGRDAAEGGRDDVVGGEYVAGGTAVPDPDLGGRGFAAPGAVLTALTADQQASTTCGAPAPSAVEPTSAVTDPWAMLLSFELTVAGVGLAGPGAVAAMRGLLLDALYTDTGRRPIVIAGLPERLGIAPYQLDALGVAVVPDLAGAELAALSTPAETVVVLAEAPDHPIPLPTLDRADSADGAGHRYDDVEADGAHEVGALRVVVLGELLDGVTAYLRTDGTIAAAGPPAARAHLLGQRLPVVDDIAGAELLDLATESRATPLPPDNEEQHTGIAAEHPADTRADTRADLLDDVSGDRADGEPGASSPKAGGTGPRRSRPVWTLQILGRPVLLLSRRASFRGEHAAADRSTLDVGDAFDVRSVLDVGDTVDVSDRVSARMFDLLVYLALHPEGARRDAVVAALWPDTGRPRPSNNLSALISRLRGALQAALDSTTDAATTPDADAATGTGEATALVVADGERYRLDTDRVAIDYHDYLAAVALATAEPDGGGPAPDQTPSVARLDPSALQFLQHALGLVRGRLAAGIDDAWIDSIREATRRNLLVITSRLVRHHVTTNPAAALAVLEITRNLEPTSQGVYRDIMALQLRLGDNEAAAATFQLLETQLADIDESLDEATIALARNLAS